MATIEDKRDNLRSADMEQIRRYLDARMVTLEAQRMSWWTHWRELAEYILPRRYRWLITANQWNRGSPINGRILNSTATLAARNCASGIMSGVSSPARPWFRLEVPDPEIMQDVEVQKWCAEVSKRIQRVMGGSNYYMAKAVQYLDLVIFGTAPMLIYEDKDQVIRCFNPSAGEYYAAVGPSNTVQSFYRKFTMTISQIVTEFGLENCTENVKSLYARQMGAGRGSNVDTEMIVCHAIEPNPEYAATDNMEKPMRVGKGGLPRHFSFREVYWEWGSSETEKVLRYRGFMEAPFSCPRWDTLGNDAYGRSPGMDALGDVKQLQLEEKRKAQAIDKMVNPPMVADPSMKNEPASLLPGAVNYAPMDGARVGMRPIYQVNPGVAELKDDIGKVEGRIKDVFFNDLFLMISQLDTVRTATEIDARREEKLVMLGPVIDRNKVEGLYPDINRIFQIMARRGLLPPPPEAMRGFPVKVDLISLLADVQSASATSGIERVWQFAGNIAAAIPSILDNLDPDETIAAYADLLRVPPQILMTKADKEAIRAKRTEEQQAAAGMQVGAEAVQAGKVLSETDVGGGQNALSAMINGV